MPKRDSNFNDIRGARRFRRSQDDVADWEGADPKLLRTAIGKASVVGGAIRFGYSRDGGAYAVGIYGDGEPYTEFVKPSEDIDRFLLDIISLFDDIQAQRMPNVDAARDRNKPPQDDLN